MSAQLGRVLAYEDVVLYEEDVETLDGHKWLTDNVVSFAASYLNSNVLREELKSKVLIVYRALCELIKNTPPGGDSTRLYEEIGLSADKWLLFIVNDNQRPGMAYGGSHWSLVLFRPTPTRRFLLFDSADSPTARRRDDPAKMDWKIREFAERLRQFLHIDDVEWELEVVQAYEDCPKMAYSGDCGVFVIEYIHAILKALNVEPQMPHFDLTHITDAYIERRRVEWKELVQRMSLESQA